MIRFIIICIILFGFLILSIPVLIIEWIIGKYNPRLKDTSSLAIVNCAFRLILLVSGVKLTVLGEENVPKDCSVLYIANHRSYFDILLTYTRVPRPTGYIAKVEMLRYPLLSHWMKYLHCQFLDRKDLKKGMQTILTSIELIKSGISICIFPEGTRNESDDQMLPFHEGSFKIAQKTNCPIIPMAITNSGEIFENHLPFIKPCPVILEYGSPIYPEQLSKENKKFMGAYCQQIMNGMLEKHKIFLETSE